MLGSWLTMANNWLIVGIHWLSMIWIFYIFRGMDIRFWCEKVHRFDMF